VRKDQPRSTQRFTQRKLPRDITLQGFQTLEGFTPLQKLFGIYGTIQNSQLNPTTHDLPPTSYDLQPKKNYN